MARNPDLPRATLEKLVDIAVRLGYDRKLIEFPERRENYLAAG
jgi:lipocalin